MLRGVTTEFDPISHHRERTRKAEARADGLELQRDRLERILLLALEVATARSNVTPLVLLDVLTDVAALGLAWDLDLYLDVA